MTDHDINRVLAEKVMGWTQIDMMWVGNSGTVVAVAIKNPDFKIAPEPWSPATDSNHLREVLAKLTAEQMDRLHVVLTRLFDEARTSAGIPCNVREMWSWTLTCDPRIIATDVAEVVK